MAVTNEFSTQIQNIDATPRVFNDTKDTHGRLRVHYFSHTQSVAGDATSTVELARLPSGNIRIYWDQSFIAWSAFGASRVLDVGHQGYTALDNTTVTAAAAAAYDDDIDVSSAGEANLGSDVAVLTTAIEANDAVSILATVAGGTIPLAATLEGYIVYAQD